MATEELGIRITAEGVFETTSGLKLTTEAVREVADQLRDATKAGGAYARAQDDVVKSTGAVTTRSIAAGSAIGAVLGGAVLSVGRAFIQKTRAVIDSTAALATLSARTGIAVERLAALQYAADQSDTNIETLTSSMARFNRVLLDAQRGSPEAAKTFKALGIDPTDVKDTETALYRIAAAFQKIDDPEFKSAILGRLRISQEMLPFLDQGVAGIKRLMDEGSKLNRVTAEQANAAKDYKDQLAKLDSAVSTSARSMVGSLLPALNQTIDRMAYAGSDGGPLWALIRGYGELWKISLQGGADPAPLRKQREFILSIKGEIAKLETSLSRKGPLGDGLLDKWVYGDAAAKQRKLAELRLTLQSAEKALVFQTEQAASANARGGEAGDISALSKDPKATKTGGSKRDEFAAALEDIRRQGQAVEELSFAEKVAADIEAGRYKQLTTNQKIALMQAAQEVTLRQQTAEVAKAQAEGEAARAEERRKAIEEDQRHWNTLAEAAEEYQKQQKEQAEGWRDLVNPTREYVREIEKVAVAMRGNRMSFDEAAAAAELLRKKMADVGKTGKSDFEELKRAVEGYGRKAADAFVDWAAGAKVSIRDVAATMLKEFASMMMYRQVFGPLFNAVGGKLASAGQNFWNTGGGVKFADLPTADPSWGTATANARGNAFDSTGIVPFARGGLVDRPTIFPFARGGVGLMGEAGTEAIMPLKRTPDGRLGVAATVNGGGGGAPAAPPSAPAIVVNIAADARSDITTLRMLTVQAVRGALAEQSRLARIGATA